MKPILIIQNIKREYPGMIQSVLDEQACSYEIKLMAEWLEQPVDLSAYSALIVLGGPDSANDATPKMQAEVQLARQALSLGLPYLGICLGHQVLVKAAGGKVVKGLQREVGWHTPQRTPYVVQLTDDGKSDPLFQGLGETIPVFQLHGEMVEVTPQMQVLATGDICPVQVVKVSNKAYGLQCHFELHDQLYQDWLNEDPDLQQLDRAWMEQYWQQVKEDYTKTGRTLIKNWLGMI